MKGLAGFVVAAAIVALGGAVLMGVAAYERNMAAAEQDLATLRYAEAAEKLDTAASYAEYTSWLPGQAGRAAGDIERMFQSSVRCRKPRPGRGQSSRWMSPEPMLTR